MITLEYGRMFQDRLDQRHGLPRARLAELAGRFAEVQAEVRRRRGAGEYGFYGLVEQGETILPFRVDAYTWIDIGRPEQLEAAHARVAELRG